MKILYIANIRFPTQMAHGAQIAKACEAFAKLGHEVELVVPKRWTPITEPWQAYYGVRKPFPVRELTVPDTVRRWGRLGFIIQILSFGFAAARYARHTEYDVVYGRDEHVLFLLSLFGVRKIVWESHDGARNFFARIVAHRAEKMVVVSEGQRDFYIENGLPSEKIISVPNGVDLAAFEQAESKTDARRRLGIPADAFVALYVGAFDGWKGTDTLFETTELLPEVLVVAIGGYKKQVAALVEKYPRVMFLGSRPYAELSDNLAAADVCVLPNTGKDPVSVRFTSPLKLLAYLAAGKPVVASDLPSVREIAGDDGALYVLPDKALSLADGIERVRREAEVAVRLSRAALLRAKKFDWVERAARISEFLSAKAPIRVLALYRGRVGENRGTPIRVRSILERLAQDACFSLTVASWDEALPFPAAHVHLSNKKFEDARALLRSARDADVVLGHTMGTWYYLAFLKLFAQRRIVLEMHGFVEEEALLYGSIGLIGYWVQKVVYGLFYRSCDLITTCSETASEVLRAYNSEVVTIFGGVDSQVFSPTVVPLSSNRRSEKIVIGYAGNSRVWQGLPFLVEAYGELQKRDTRFTLALLVSETKGIPYGKGITCFSRVPHGDVPRFLAGCDLLVIPRPATEVNRLSFPSKLIEYMAMGKPVIASSTSDVGRVITDEKDGLLYTPGDREALIAAIIRLADPTFRTRLGLAAAQKATEQFEWGRQTDILAGHLETLFYGHV